MVPALVSQFRTPGLADVHGTPGNSHTDFHLRKYVLWLWAKFVADVALISGFAAVMAAAPAEAAAQESQVIPSGQLTVTPLTSF